MDVYIAPTVWYMNIWKHVFIHFTEKIHTKRPSSTKTTSTPPRIITTSTVLPPIMETTTPRIYGKNPEKVPTVLFGNRLLVICLYSAVVFCITLSILVALCMLIRCRKQAPSEVSSDTASSDLPIIKADAKRYNAQIR